MPEPRSPPGADEPTSEEAEPKEPDASDLSYTSRAWLARAGVLVIGIVLLRLGFELWWVGRIHEHLWVQFGVMLLYLAGATFLFLSAVDIPHHRLDKAGFVVLSFALGFYALAHLRVFATHYPSDAMLFVHQAALIFLDGGNPYQWSYVGGYEAFQVPYYVQTPTSSGGLITNLNYPALSFLMYVPFASLGLTDMRAVNAAFLLALIGLVYLRTPRHLRLLTLSILFMSSFFLSFALTGFDIIYIFFLVAAVILWRVNPKVAMVAFGLACAVKQQPWFIAPFLMIRLWRESPALSSRDRLMDTLGPASYAIGAFLVPNALFLLWDPMSWITGILTPIGGSGETLVPLAQGILILNYTGAVFIDPALMGLLALSVFVCLLGLYWHFHDRMKEAAWMAPVLILLFNSRALQNYYEMFYPVGLAALLAVLPNEWEDHRPAAQGEPAASALDDFELVGPPAPDPPPDPAGGAAR